MFEEGHEQVGKSVSRGKPTMVILQEKCPGAAAPAVERLKEIDPVEKGRKNVAANVRKRKDPRKKVKLFGGWRGPMYKSSRQPHMPKTSSKKKNACWKEKVRQQDFEEVGLDREKMELALSSCNSEARSL